MANCELCGSDKCEEGYLCLACWGKVRTEMRKYGIDFIRFGLAKAFAVGYVRAGRTREASRIYHVGMEALAKQFPMPMRQSVLPVNSEQAHEIKGVCAAANGGYIN